MSSSQLRGLFAQYLPALIGALMGLIGAATAYLGGQGGVPVPRPFAPINSSNLARNPAAPGTSTGATTGTTATASGAVPTPQGATLTSSGTATGTSSSGSTSTANAGTTGTAGAVAASGDVQNG